MEAVQKRIVTNTQFIFVYLLIDLMRLDYCGGLVKFPDHSSYSLSQVSVPLIL